MQDTVDAFKGRTIHAYHMCVPRDPGVVRCYGEYADELAWVISEGAGYVVFVGSIADRLALDLPVLTLFVRLERLD